VKSGTPGWALAGPIWLGAALLVTGLVYQRSPTGRVDWLFVVLLSTAFTGIVVAFVRALRTRPSPMQRAALEAIFHAKEPGTIGAVLVMKNGTPEVIATVRSREEYLELAASGRLPEEHLVFLPDDA
jgi:hypothetical protein